MGNLTRVRAYLQYWFQAKNAHGIHSPFVFDFYQHVWKSTVPPVLDPEIERLRRELIQDHSTLSVTDLGAGSSRTPGRLRKVSDIARFSSKSPFWVQRILRILQHYSYTRVLDLGSSLGLTTSYLARHAQVVSVEGCPNIGKKALANWKRLGLEVDFVEGNLDNVLPALLNSMPPFDLILLDANHRYEPTIRYVQDLLNHLPPHGCLILDDIHWSREMDQAWSEIIQDPRVSVSIDVFEMGILFKRPQQTKQHFILR